MVVSPQMKRWQALHTLALVYRDAYNNQLNDRYWNKWEEYRELARGVKERTLQYGIGLVATPVPWAGTPSLGTAVGTLAAATYYVQVSWLSVAGQEGSASAVTTFQTTDNSLLTVIATNPPEGGGGDGMLYLGPTVSTLTLQNSAPLAIGATFTLPGPGLARSESGPGADGGHVRNLLPNREAREGNGMAQAASIAVGKVRDAFGRTRRWVRRRRQGKRSLC